MLTAQRVRAKQRAAVSRREAQIEDEELESGEINLIPYLDIVTLTGLLGTITGLIATFAALGEDATERATKLSEGIAEAMYNTAFGLLIAVMCMIAHVILHTRAKAIAHDLEALSERVFNLLTDSSKPNY